MLDKNLGYIYIYVCVCVCVCVYLCLFIQIVLYNMISMYIFSKI